MFSNPITSVFGFLILLCPVIEAIFPDFAGSCTQVQTGLMGAGLVASRDGVKTTTKTNE